MVVVGHTGGGFTGMFVGSTAAAVVSHAHCPVPVVRGRFGPSGAPPEDGPVVVGVDGSPVSEQAVATAFDEASVRGVPLVAVHAWSDDTYAGGDETNRNLADWDATDGDDRRVLAERVHQPGARAGRALPRVRRPAPTRRVTATPGDEPVRDVR
jgi:nucleotide-binding universal stress UspA family protein